MRQLKDIFPIVFFVLICVLFVAFGVTRSYNHYRNTLLPNDQCFLNSDDVTTSGVHGIAGMVSGLGANVYSVNLNERQIAELGFTSAELTDTETTPAEFVKVNFEGQTVTAQAFGSPELWKEGDCIVVSVGLVEILDLKAGDIVTLERND